MYTTHWVPMNYDPTQALPIEIKLSGSPLTFVKLLHLLATFLVTLDGR